ncbi:MAG: PAS domain S-box-containing protein [Flavobacteriales bacterium]|jgi:PAS domain S-box-containing protein
MKFVVVLLCVFLLSNTVEASVIDVFKDEYGRTKWQHVANFSASVLILLLTVVVSALLYSFVRLRKVNSALKDIRRNLEDTVEKRTANLKVSNDLLGGEIAEHKETSHLLQSSQNYLQSILASMPAMLVGLDDEMRVTHWNNMAEDITGLKAEEVLGENLWDVYPTVTLTEGQIKKVLDSNTPEVIKHSQRGQYYFDITVFPLQGATQGVVLAIDNVTQRTLAENMLIQRDKLASMGELASMMAHDINTPLKAMSLDVEKVYEEFSSLPSLPESSVELLRDAVERGKQASAVISNLLAFSSEKDGEKRAMPPVDLIEHSLGLANDVLSEPTGLRFRDISVRTSIEEGLPDLLCYPAELEQVLLSLYRHSLYAMSIYTVAGHKPEIHIEAYQSYGSLWLKVQHNGQGLSEKEQLDIFEPFFSSVSTLKPKQIDMSKRLSFSHFIVTEQHRGQMAVTSDLAIGTTFHMQFELPAE